MSIGIRYKGIKGESGSSSWQLAVKRPKKIDHRPQLKEFSYGLSTIDSGLLKDKSEKRQDAVGSWQETIIN